MVTTVFLPLIINPCHQSRDTASVSLSRQQTEQSSCDPLWRQNLETFCQNSFSEQTFHQRHLFTFGDFGKHPEENSYVLCSLKCVGAAHTSPLALIFITELTQPLPELLKLTASCLLRLLCSKCGENTDSAHQISTRALVTQPRPQLYPRLPLTLYIHWTNPTCRKCARERHSLRKGRDHRWRGPSYGK